MTTELENQKNNAVSTFVDYGAGDDISVEDCQMGRVAIMQSMSKLVQDDKAEKGQIVNIVDGTVLGDKKSPFEFIIVGSYKYWIEKEGDKFVGKYPAVSQNEKPWEEGNISRLYHHAFLVLSVNDIADGLALPYELAFRSTDIKTAAQKLSGFLMKLRGKQLPSWTKTFKLTAEEKTKDKYKWFGAAIEEGRQATEAEIQYAKEAREQFNLYKAVAMKKVENDEVSSSSENIQDAEF